MSDSDCIVGGERERERERDRGKYAMFNLHAYIILLASNIIKYPYCAYMNVTTFTIFPLRAHCLKHYGKF